MMGAQDTTPHNGRVITTDADYAAASDYLQAMQVAMLTTSDNRSASLASAYIAGEALAASDSLDGGEDDTTADERVADSDAIAGRGAFAFTILAFMIGGASFAALALYLMASHSF